MQASATTKGPSVTPSYTPATPRRRPDRQDPLTVRAVSDELFHDLAAAQEERDQRALLNQSGQPEWVAYERGVMVDGTIALLIRHQLPIDADEALRAVTKAEQSAAGHSDYTRTWAIGCARYIVSVAQGARQEA